MECAYQHVCANFGEIVESLMSKGVYILVLNADDP